MKIKLYLKRPKATSESTIFALANYNGLTVKIYTEESIIPQKWNFKKQVARTTLDESTTFNLRLDKIKGTIVKTFQDYKNAHDNEMPSPAILKPLIEQALRKDQKKMTFLAYFEEFAKKQLMLYG